MGSPDRAARSRYQQSFQSSIFEPLPTPQGPAFVPAGKRRDQTTSEMWGIYHEKDCRGMPKTFVPKEDSSTAREKKLDSLRSDVLHRGTSRAGAAEAPAYDPAPRERLAFPDMEHDEAVDTNQRRQTELQSKLFDRPTPVVDSEQLQGPRGTRLTPNDFKWHSHPTSHAGQDGRGVELEHRERAYREKCSNVFDHQSPQMLGAHLEAARRDKQEDLDGDKKRHDNAYFSDLFGRTAPSAASADGPCERRCKPKGHSEDLHVVHQDWTDSKTELLRRQDRPEHPALRKSEELHQARIFGPRAHAWAAPTEKMAPMVQDTSEKTRSAYPRSTMEVHQAHLRSSVTESSFYDEARSATEWEVAELHISGLGIHANNDSVRSLCQGSDLQIVKVAADVDPVRNLCNGRAKVIVRYNPNRSSVEGLVRKLEASSLRVDL